MANQPMKSEFEIRLIDNVSDSISKIQKAIDRLNLNPLESLIQAFNNSSFKSNLKNITKRFHDLADISNKIATQMKEFNDDVLKGVHEWGKKTVETQSELQRTLGLIATKITDTSLKEFNDRMKFDLDITQPEDKLKLLNSYLRDVSNQAKGWSLGVGEFAKISPMSQNDYLGSIKQLLSSGLSETEATLATKYSSVMSKALEATHADAAYDMARIYNNIKAVTPKNGFIDTEDTMKRISSIFDYMDNNFQFKIGKNAIAQLRKTLAVGLTRGFNLEELGITAGFISSTGLEGGMGDTALKEFISRLAIAETKAKKFGLPFEYMGNETLPQIIMKLKEATSKLNKKSRAEFLREAFGERGVQTAERVIEQAEAIAEHVKKAQEATAGFGSSFSSAFIRSQDFNTALDGFNSRIDFFNGAVGRYTVGLRWMFADLFNNAVSYLAGTHNILARLTGQFLGSFSVAGGVFASLGADLITLAYAPIQFLASLGLAINGVGKILPLLKIFGIQILSLASSIGIFSLGIIKNTFSLNFWTKTLWKGILASMKMIVKIALLSVGYTLLGVAMAIGAIAQGIYNLLMWLAVPPTLIVGGLIALTTLSILALGAAILWLWNNWDSVWNSLGSGIQNLAIWLKDMATWLWEMFDGFMESIFGGLWRGVKKFFGWIFSGIKKIVDFISSYFDGDKILANAKGGSIDFGGNPFEESAPALQKRKRSDDFSLPAGYAYQIDNRFSGAKGVSDVVHASENSRIITPETPLDAIQKIYSFMVSTWGGGVSSNKVTLSPTGSGLSVGSGDKKVIINIQNIDEIWQVVEFVEFLKEKVTRL